MSPPRPGRVWLLRPALLVLCLLLPAPLHALLLTDDTPMAAVSGLQIVSDPTEQLTLADVLALPPEAFQAAPLNLGYRRGAVWGRLVLDNRSRHEQWLLRIGEPRLWSVELFQDSSAGWLGQRSGTGWPLAERSIAHRAHLFPVHSVSGEQTVLLFRVTSPTAIALPVSVWQPEALLADSQRRSLVLGGSLGFVLGICLFFLLMFAVLREPLYALLGLCALSSFAYRLAFDGVLYVHFEQWLGAWSLHPILLFSLLTQAALVGFTLCFLELRRSAPRLHRALQLVIAGLLALALLVLLLPFALGAQLVAVWWVFTALLITAAAVWSWMQGNRAARLLCVGFGLVCLVLLVTLLEIYGLAPVEVGAIGRQTIWLITLPVVAVAFAERQQILGREQQQAQRTLLSAERTMVEDLEKQVAQRTAEVEQALRLATAANAAKDDFLATMSHELRTPLTTLVGVADLLEETVDSPEQRQLLAAQHQAGRHLLKLVDDLLDLARIEHGGVRLEQVAFSPQALLGDLITMFRPQAEAGGLSLNLELDALPAALLGDPERIHQVLANLVVNAIKYTAAGGVVIHGSISPLADGRQSLVVLVEDTGVGMDARLRRLAFRPFEQGDGAQGGVGLGLSIVLRLVSAMGGSVDVDSEPGLGSRFRVQIPLRPAEEAAAAAQQPRQPRSQRLLLVEDVPENRLIISRLLQREGHAVVAVSDAAAALRALEGQAFDAVLLDLGLPDLDGRELARLIRASRSGEWMPRLIALTARAEAERLLQGEFDAVLSKPLDRVLLRRALDSDAGARAVAGDRPTPLPAAGMELAADERALLDGLHQQTCREVAVALRRALDADDADEILAAAHRLAGSALQMGKQDLAVRAQAAERAVMTGDSGPARALWRRLTGQTHGPC